MSAASLWRPCTSKEADSLPATPRGGDHSRGGKPGVTHRPRGQFPWAHSLGGDAGSLEKQLMQSAAGTAHPVTQELGVGCAHSQGRVEKASWAQADAGQLHPSARRLEGRASACVQARHAEMLVWPANVVSPMPGSKEGWFLGNPAGCIFSCIVLARAWIT